MNTSGIDGYRTYLEKRDGDADLLNRRLASREEFFTGLEADPVRSTRDIDRLASRGTCAVAAPSQVSTARCCFCWPPPS
jgi:hypothetical protein